MGQLVFYNDVDAHAAQWLSNLITAGLIPAGTVDERDIRGIKANEVQGYQTAHWFAGIGGWAHALDLAGWDATRPVWSASLPCQPFSSAGKGLGEEDERHLWPTFFALVRECRPDTIIGEQSASKAGIRWLDGIRTDLESAGYAFGAAALTAAGAGAPHIRQRLYWVATLGGVANSEAARRGRRTEESRGLSEGVRAEGRGGGPADTGEPRGVADSAGEGRRRQGCDCGAGDGRADESRRLCAACRLADTERGGRTGRTPDAGRGEVGRTATSGAGETGGVGHTDGGRCLRGEERNGIAPAGQSVQFRADADRSDAGVCGVGNAVGDGSQGQHCHRPAPGAVERADGAGAGFWDDFDIIPCRDGKYRRVERGIFPLVAGVPWRLADGTAGHGSRAKALRGIGNAIAPPLAATFIRAFLEAEQDVQS